MIVNVRLFAAAKDLAGRDAIAVEVPDCASVAEIRAAVLKSAPALAGIIPHAMWAIDAQYAAADTRVSQLSEVALIPPVSGG